MKSKEGKRNHNRIEFDKTLLRLAVRVMLMVESRIVKETISMQQAAKLVKDMAWIGHVAPPNLDEPGKQSDPGELQRAIDDAAKSIGDMESKEEL